jgi:hypothetical protein
VTTFDEDGLPQATNHAGWDVQVLTYAGWGTIHPEPFESKSDAKEVMAFAQEMNRHREYRIYEALT